MESPFIEKVFIDVLVSCERFVVSFQSYISNVCVHVESSLRNMGSQHPLVLLLRSQFLFQQLCRMVQAFFSFGVAQFICIASAPCK